MKELIRIEKMDNGKRAVSAKELYRFLTDGDIKNYARWLKMNITKNAFLVENVDYMLSSCVTTTPRGGQVGKDYALTVDLAYKLSMLSRTKRGDEARDYFLACKKELDKLLQQQTKPMTVAEIVAANANMLVEHEKAINAVVSRQDKNDVEIKQVAERVTTLNNSQIINNDEWRAETTRIINQIVDNNWTYTYESLKHEIYETLNKRAHVNVFIRRKKMQQRMKLAGVAQTKINQVSILDVIEADCKIKEAYKNIVKEFAIRLL
jgi:anti-repressor protein